MKGTILAGGARRKLAWRASLPTRIPHVGVYSWSTLDPVSQLENAGPIWDQGEEGACTSFGTAGVAWTALKNVGKQPFEISHAFEYWCARTIEGTSDQDSGATISDSMAAMNRYGIVPETAFPYVPGKFAVKPPDAVFQEAIKQQAHEYGPCMLTPGWLHGTLRHNPIVFGITVYPSFENVSDNGMIPLPDAEEEALGGHCIDIFAFNSGRAPCSFPLANSKLTSIECPPGYLVIRNSWGTSWGLAGWGLLPIAYAIDPNLASDGWVLASI